MVVRTDEGWIGANGIPYDSPHAAWASIASAMRWPQPKVSSADRQQPRPLKVFLCHAHEDKETVRQLYARLQGIGVAPWLDEVDILPGQRWRDEISKAIRACDAFLACLSRTAVSKTGYINKEFREALTVADEQPWGRIFIIPVRLDNCDVPDRFRDIQWVDYYRMNGMAALGNALSALADWLRDKGALVDAPRAAMQ